MRAVFTSSMVVVLAISATSCESPPESGVASAPPEFKNAELVPERVMTVADADDPAVGGILVARIDPSDSSSMAIVDRIQSTVSLIDLDHSEVIARTRSPAVRPIDVDFRNDSVLLADADRMIRIADRSTLEIHRSFELDEHVIFPRRLHPTPTGFLAESTDTYARGPTIFEYDMAGNLVQSWHEFEESDFAPFWGEFFWEHVAIHEDDVFVASAMRYPLFRYGPDGSVTTFGNPPDDYRSARRPVGFEFSASPEARARYEVFVRTFTTISSIHTVGDLLVVEHRDFDESERAFRSPSFSLDIYRTGTLNKVAEGVPSPGRIVGSNSDQILVLTAQPPAGDWQITAFSISFQVSDP